MPEPIHLGFIGLSTKGWASTNLAPPLLKGPLSSKYRIAAICTTNAESAKASAEKHTVNGYTPTEYTLESVDDLIYSDDVDMVAVSVNIRHHLKLGKKVLNAGKPLFVEWPAGVDLKETKELAALAKVKGVRSIVGLQARQSLVFRKVKEIVGSGKIGRVLSTEMTARLPANLPGGGRSLWGPSVPTGREYQIQRENGATMLDIPGGHFIDPLIYILGPISSVSSTLATQFPTATVYDSSGKATGETIHQNAPNQVAVTGVLASGAVMSIHLRSGMEVPESKAALPFVWTIDGTKGTVRLENDHPMAMFVEMFPPSRLTLNDEEITIPEDGKTNEGRAWGEFLKGTGNGNYTDLDDALKIKAVIDAIWRSADEGSVVKV